MTEPCRLLPAGLRLALLAPDLVEAVLNGTQGVELSLPGMLEGCPWFGASRGVSLNQRQGPPEQQGPLSTHVGRTVPGDLIPKAAFRHRRGSGLRRFTVQALVSG